MKLKRIFLAGTVSAALAAAAVMPSVLTDWFSQTFDGLADGTSFTGAQGGTSGGSWGTIASGVATVQTVGGRKCIEVDTSLAASASDIRFTADQPAPGGIERFEFALCAEPMPWYPQVRSGDKGALLLMANDGGLLTFGAYVVGGMSGRWITLYGHGFTQRSREWIDCRAEFDYGSATASFFAKLDGVNFQPLADADGNTRFTIVGTRATAIAFSGKGAIGAFAGTCVTYATTENVWKGADGGDWGVASNWSLGKVPGVGDVAVVGIGKVVSRTVGGRTCDIRTWADSKLVLGDDGGIGVESGDVQLFGDYSSWGVIVAAPKAKLRAQGAFYGIEMGYASTLQVDPATNVVVTAKPIHLDGVNVNLQYAPSSRLEAFELVKGPYGSGGDPLALTVMGVASTWYAAWHGRLDGASSLWVVNKEFAADTAVWNGGTWGNLAAEENWGATKPSENCAAQIRYGQAHVNQWDAFSFTRWLEIGSYEGKGGSMDMSGGRVIGAGDGAAVVVGKGDGAGALDVVGGVVRPASDYLWNYALTVGADAHSKGTVKVRGGVLEAAAGGVSVGAAGSAQMEICEGRAVANGPFAVGYAGRLDVTGGSLILSNAVYIGRSTRGEAYDVTMTVDGGAVSQFGAETFCVGSYGGVGSRALLTLASGEMRVARTLVCGARRSARVDVTGGTLVAPEIDVGRSLVDAEDAASFNLLGGRVETAGFASGANGARTVTLSGGELVATAANDDFFQGLDLVRLDGAATIVNEADVTVKAGLIGPGGFIKTGAGTFKASGYAAWSGKTTVQAGTLDMDGGMILGEIEIAEGASVVNAKYDDIDSLSMNGDVWKSGNASTMPYLSVSKDLTAQSSSIMKATGGDGVLKGAVTFVADDDGLAFAGWTPFGWVKLGFADGTSVVPGQTYSVAMKFDFDRKGGNGKGYVFYYVYRDDTQERLVSEDGLSAFPVAGALSVKTFDGFGLQMKIDDALVARWKGGVYGKWTDTANWSTGSVPAGGMRAFVDTPATIDVAGANLANPIALLVANARVTLTGGALKFTGSASGAGMLVLSNATLKAGDIQLPVVSAAGTQNAIEGASARLYGALRGEGDISVEADLHGDTSAFAGRLNLIDGAIGSSEAAQNARSAWNVSGFPFGVSDLTYEFGALNGTFSGEAGDVRNVTLAVGARNEDCRLGGSWFAGSGSGLEWTARTATLDYDVSNTAFLRLSGGGKIAVNDDAGVPAALSFVGNGGEFRCGPAVTADVSGIFAPSTAPVTFHDGGADRTWMTALTASNVVGLVKRGAGALTLGAVPRYSGATVVEEGTLVVPYGTRIDSLTVQRAGKIVVDMAYRTESGVALSIGCSNRDLLLFKDRYFSVTNVAAGVEYEIKTQGNNGLVVLHGSNAFVWTGAMDNQWSNAGNWTVDGATATRAPAAQDDVLFEDSATVVVDAAEACNVTGLRDLCIVGTNTTLSVAGVVRQEGLLTLDGGLSLSAADMAISALAGTGTVHAASGRLVISPSDISSKFVGTLDVTNLVKTGGGVFEYEPRARFSGSMSVEEGLFRWNCSYRGMSNETSVALSMLAGAQLRLCGQDVTVGSFVGAGEVTDGTLITADGMVFQYGGALSIPAADQTTYIASRAGELLRIDNANGMLVEVVIPRSWFVAGVSGKRAVFCDGAEILWNIESKSAVAPVDERDGYWSIGGGGFTIRLK